MNITKFGLENFRIFKDYYEFNLAPIMVLTGPNSSGKSSFSKALLLLKANEYELNMNIHWDIKLNYLKGKHDLGNHKFTINNINKNSFFTLTFFDEYKLKIEIDSKGLLLNDYCIVERSNDTVISQLGGYVFINVLKFINFLIKRIDFLDLKINANMLEKFIYFTKKLIDFQKDFQFVSLDIISDFDYQINKLRIFKDEEKVLKEIEENIQNGILSRLYYDNQDIENHPNEDGDKEDLLTFLFKKITLIDFTSEEIKLLLPPCANMFTYHENPISFFNLIYVDTFREPFKRSYLNNENSFFPKFINSQICKEEGDISSKPIEYRISAKKTEGYDDLLLIEKFIKKWIFEFELGSELYYGYNDEHDFYFIKIDNKSLNEVGLGFGLVIRLMLELLHQLEYLKYRRPINEELIISFPQTCIIEEPETGLHPSFQSKVAELLVDFQKKFNVNLIIETHSEYFIRKLQYLTANNEIKSGDAVIYYFNNPKKIPEGEEQIKKITIEEDGSLTDNFGPGFIDEGTNLKFELLRLNKSRQN